MPLESHAQSLAVAADDLSALPAALEMKQLRVKMLVNGQSCEIVRGIDLHVPASGAVALVGESGSGKSVSARAIIGLLPNSATVAAEVLTSDGAAVPLGNERQLLQFRRSKVSMIFQDPQRALNPTMRIRDQIAEAVRLSDPQSGDRLGYRVRQLLDLVRIPAANHRHESYPHELSGGMRQRIAIAIALAGRPRLLIADEPTTALDVTIQAEILDLILDIQQEESMGLLLITHDLALAAERTATTYVMYAGSIVERCDSNSLRRTAMAPYTQALMTSRPDAQSLRESDLPSLPGAPPHLGTVFGGCPFEPRCPRALQLTEDERERCRTAAPALIPAALDGQMVACWYPTTLTAGGASADAPDEFDSDSSAQVVRRPEILSVSELSSTYMTSGRRSSGSQFKVLDRVSLEVAKGEILGVVGESGCGKSTLLMSILGATHASGAVAINGRDMLNLNRRGRRESARDVQLVPQDPYSSMDPFWTISRIVAEPLLIQGVGTREAREKVAFLLEDVGLDFSTYASRRPRQMSGGQLQRVAIARALALEPELLIADEAIASLDVTSQAQILNLLLDLRRRRNLAIIFVSHDLSAVRHISDRIVVMYMGRIVESLPGQLVPHDMAHPYTHQLYSSLPGVRDRTQLASGGEERAIDLPSLDDPPSGCRFHTRCPRAQAVCSSVNPEPFVFGDGHVASCHFPITASHNDSTTDVQPG